MSNKDGWEDKVKSLTLEELMHLIIWVVGEDTTKLKLSYAREHQIAFTGSQSKGCYVCASIARKLGVQ